MNCLLVIVAWFAILFSGRYPRGIFDFVVGVQRWSLRVQAYRLVSARPKIKALGLSDNARRVGEVSGAHEMTLNPHPS